MVSGVHPPSFSAKTSNKPTAAKVRRFVFRFFFVMVWCFAKPRAGKQGKEGKKGKKGSGAGKYPKKTPKVCLSCNSIACESLCNRTLKCPRPDDPARRMGQEWDRATLGPRFAPCKHNIPGNSTPLAFVFADIVVFDSSSSDGPGSSGSASSIGSSEIVSGKLVDKNAARMDVESVTDADSHD